MRIIRCEFWPVTMALAVPYTIAYETISSCTNVFLRVITDTEHVGLGCAAPDLEVTGETPESVLEACSSHVEPTLKGADGLRLAVLLDALKGSLRPHPSVLAMVDMALYDLLGKAAAMPVHLLLGGYRQSMPTSVTIGILPLAETLERVRSWKEQGVFIIKLKGGVSVDEDVERVMRTRELLGDRGEIRFDANQGYSLDNARDFVNRTKAAAIELLEQPTPRDRFDLLGQVSQNVSVPVMADESVMNLKDTLRLAKADQADMVNIKLQKVGGIFEALRINSVAHAAGYEVMVGCMDEAALAIAAGLHFALARPNVLYADLDGHLDLMDDPSAGSVELRDGVLYPTNLPGLGANLRTLE
jgi:L-alanine-DL-glutamate epimerase-like enolase superfamily enzyme